MEDKMAAVGALRIMAEMAPIRIWVKFKKLTEVAENLAKVSSISACVC